MPRDAKKVRTKDKGKDITTISNKKAPAKKESTIDPEIQNTIDLSTVLAKEVDQIQFRTEGMHDLYDE